MLAKPRWSATTRVGVRAATRVEISRGMARRVAFIQESTTLSREFFAFDASFPSVHLVTLCGRTLHAGAGAMATVCARARLAGVSEPRVARRSIGRAGDARRASRGTPRPVRSRGCVVALDALSGDAGVCRGGEPRVPGSAGLASAIVAAAAASAVALSAPAVLAEESAVTSAHARFDTTENPLSCAGDPSCASARDAALVAGGEYAPPAEYAEDDPDGALRRAICPRNPTADICRSQRDRKRQNDSPCKVPLLNACLVWKEGASKDVVLKR
jgi:hypothetical protein